MNMDGPSGFFGGLGILLNRSWLNVRGQRHPVRNSEGLFVLSFYHGNATVIRQSVLPSGHLGRCTWCFLSHPLCSSRPIPMSHSLIWVLSHSSLFWRVRDRFHYLWQVYHCETKVLSFACLWHADQVFKLPWNNVIPNLWDMDRKIKLSFLTISQIAHSK